MYTMYNLKIQNAVFCTFYKIINNNYSCVCQENKFK